MNEIPGPPAMPSQPFDIDEFVPLAELLAAAERHEWAVVAAGCGAERLAAREVADHAIAALALSMAAVIRLQQARGVTIRDALAHGASLEEVAAALSYTPEEAVDDLDDWADAQVRVGAMDGVDRDRVRVLVAPGGRCPVTGEERAYPLPAVRARAAELERRITDAPDEATAREQPTSCTRCSTAWRTSSSCPTGRGPEQTGRTGRSAPCVGRSAGGGCPAARP